MDRFRWLKKTKIESCKKSGHSIYDGHRQRVCRTCDLKRTKHRYQTSESYKQWHRNWAFKRYQIFKKIVDDAKRKPCADCKIQYEPYVMQLDHREGTKKQFTIGQKGRMQSKKRLLVEIDKCEVVCANCHSRRTYKNIPKIMSRRIKRPIVNRAPIHL